MEKLKDSRGHPFIYLYEMQEEKKSKEGKKMPQRDQTMSI